MCRNVGIKFLPWIYMYTTTSFFRQPCDSYKSQRERERDRERQRQRDRDRETETERQRQRDAQRELT